MTFDAPLVRIVTDPTGQPVARSISGVDAEYGALRAGAVVYDRSYRGRTLIEGEQGAVMLTGLVTNDVVALAPGEGQYAAAPTPKGKILTDLRIFVLSADRLVVDVPPRAAAGWHAMLKKFLPPRLAKHRETTGEMATIGVYGRDARTIAARATGLSAESLHTLPPYHHRLLPQVGPLCFVTRSPDLGPSIDGFDLFVPTAVAESWRVALEQAGAVPGGLDSWEIARIEAGRPEWGLDVDDGTIPQEANFDELHAISYTKGCYTGQETIARVHFRGHVNRHVRGLRAPDGVTLPPLGAVVFDGEKEVGTLRSSAHSPRLGTVALAMVRREVLDGQPLVVRGPEGDVPVTLCVLPFAAP